MAGESLSGRGLVSVASATILVALQAVTVAIAAGWAFGGLFGIGDIGEYVLMALFSALALYMSGIYLRKALQAERSVDY